MSATLNPQNSADAATPIARSPRRCCWCWRCCRLWPFATDLYLPAFPEMTGDLHTSATAVQLTLTAFLLGVTLGQLVRPTVRPLRPREAAPRRRRAVRRRGCCRRTRPNVGILVAARFAQGLGGAAGMVIGRAIISDHRPASGQPRHSA